VLPVLFHLVWWDPLENFPCIVFQCNIAGRLARPMSRLEAAGNLQLNLPDRSLIRVIEWVLCVRNRSWWQ
jgi:hypothetical protein